MVNISTRCCTWCHRTTTCTKSFFLYFTGYLHYHNDGEGYSIVACAKKNLPEYMYDVVDCIVKILNLAQGLLGRKYRTWNYWSNSNVLRGSATSLQMYFLSNKYDPVTTWLKICMQQTHRTLWSRRNDHMRKIDATQFFGWESRKYTRPNHTMTVQKPTSLKLKVSQLNWRKLHW